MSQTTVTPAPAAKTVRFGAKGHCAEHNRRKSECTKCGTGGSVCEHKKRRRECPTCDPSGFLMMQVRTKYVRALRRRIAADLPIPYLECTAAQLIEHLELQFKEGMSWENYGKVWQADHIVPLKYGNPTIDQVIERLHFSNMQPMLAAENMSKRNRFVGRAGAPTLQ